MPFEDFARRAGRTLLEEFGRSTARLRALPSFLLIGAKRAGTTSLWRYLEQHPDIAPLFPSARLPLMRQNQKGVHYFDSHAQRSVNWYRGHFPTEAYIARRGAIVGEASPYYLFHPRAAERAARVVPHAKVIVLLREPLDRTHSAWSEQARNGIERLSFREALAAERARVGNDEARLAAGTIQYSFAHEFQTYAAQSRYTTSLDRWQRCFGAQQMLVLRSEDLYREPEATTRVVTTFLGLAPAPLRDPDPWNASARLPIDDDLTQALTTQFHDDRAELRDRYGITWP